MYIFLLTLKTRFIKFQLSQNGLITMTELLKKAFDEAATLSPDDQDTLAQQILEIQSELIWQEKFTNSQDQLAKLADEAMAEHRAGKTHQMGFDEL